jgi:hypothetical protein
MVGLVGGKIFDDAPGLFGDQIVRYLYEDFLHLAWIFLSSTESITTIQFIKSIAAAYFSVGGALEVWYTLPILNHKEHRVHLSDITWNICSLPKKLQERKAHIRREKEEAQRVQWEIGKAREWQLQKEALKTQWQHEQALITQQKEEALKQQRQRGLRRYFWAT